MRQFSSKQDFCDWLNQFQHPFLIQDWASQPNIVSVEAQGFKITLPFAALSLPEELSSWIAQQQLQNVVRKLVCLMPIFMVLQCL